MLDKLRSFLFGPADSGQTFAAPKQPLYSEIAFARMLQYFAAVPDPDELLKQAGIRRDQLRLLDLDDEVHGRIEDRVSALIATPWSIEPSGSRAEKFVRGELEKVMESIDRSTIAAVCYGYSMSEAVYARLPVGKVGIESFSEKPIEWFDFSSMDGLWHYHADDGSGGYLGIPCDPRKFFPIVRNPTTRNPYGESILARLWFPVTWRREGWGLWLNFLETFGEPIITGNVRNQQAFSAAMQAQGVRSVIAWQGGKDDKIESIQGSTPGEFQRLEEALTKRIQKLILGNTMTTDGGQYGSRASGEVGLQVEDARRFSDIRMGARAAQKLIDVLCSLNGFPPLRFERRDETGLEAARATRDKDLAPVLQSSGLQFSRVYFQDNYALAETDLEVGQPAAPLTASATDDKTIKGHSEGLRTESEKRLFEVLQCINLSASTDKTPEAQKALDKLTNAAMGLAPKEPIPPALIQSAIMAARDKEDLERRLLAIFESSDSQDPEFQAVLEKANFAAQVLGYVAADELKT